MKIEELIEQAAKELPLGAIISIAVENGSAYVEAQTGDDECFSMDTADMSLQEEFIAALEWCKNPPDLPIEDYQEC